MIQFKNIKENAKKAYENGEIFEFITGRNGYELRVIDVPVDVPTDWTRIIPNGIYALYEETQDAGIIEEYQKAIKRAINESYEDLWSAVNILYFQFDEEKANNVPFLIDPNITNGLKDRIIKSKTELGKRFPYGKNGWNMYEDILRLNQNFVDDWGYSFLDE
jgi:hypothetical protein